MTRVLRIVGVVENTFPLYLSSEGLIWASVPRYNRISKIYLIIKKIRFMLKPNYITCRELKLLFSVTNGQNIFKRVRKIAKRNY